MKYAGWFLAFGIAVGSLAVSVTGLAQQQGQNYETVMVGVVTVGGNATVGGTVIPFKEITLTAQIPGQVDFIAGTEGDAVKIGAPLVGINDDDIRAQRRAVIAEIYNAQAAMQNAQVQYSRELYSPRTNSLTGMPGMGMPSMFDQFFTRNIGEMSGRTYPGLERHADLYAQGSGVNQAQSRLTQSRAKLESMDAKLRDARLTAPFDGIIVEKLVEVGDTAHPGTPLLRFAHTEFLRIETDVPVRLVSGLRKGMMVKSRLDAGNQQVWAKVAQIFPMADQMRHTVKIKLDLPKGTLASPGMYVEVTLPDNSVPPRSLPAIPENALLWRGSLPTVFILKDGQPSLRIVRVGYSLGDGRTTILSGLTGGEQLILNPPANLVSGKR